MQYFVDSLSKRLTFRMFDPKPLISLNQLTCNPLDIPQPIQFPYPLTQITLDTLNMKFTPEVLDAQSEKYSTKVGSISG